MYSLLPYKRIHILLKAFSLIILWGVSTTAYARPNGLSLYADDDSVPGQEVYITGLKTFMGPVDAGAKDGVIRKNITHVQSLNLSPDQVSFVIEYTTDKLTDSPDTRYAYRLQGLEEDWNYVGTQQFAFYSSLPPGTYSFQVRTENKGQNEAAHDTVEITILPPFWQSPKAYILYIILIPGIIYGFANLYTIKPRKEPDEPPQKKHTVTEKINRPQVATPDGAQPAAKQTTKGKTKAPERGSFKKPGNKVDSGPEIEDRNPADEQFLTEALDYIYTNMPDGDISVEKLAAYFHMNRSNLYRKIKAITGQTATEFIRSVRMKKALKYMENGENNISEVAFKVGFDSPGYFTRCFKKQFGLTPSQYRPRKEKNSL